MNASRMLLDRYVLWGTDKFASVPKIDSAGAICEADIHYREYRRSELAQMITESGLRILSMRYMGFGQAHGESRLKTLIKRSPALNKLTTQRPICKHPLCSRSEASGSGCMLSTGCGLWTAGRNKRSSRHNVTSARTSLLWIADSLSACF
jgi:hypothetical protein